MNSINNNGLHTNNLDYNNSLNKQETKIPFEELFEINGRESFRNYLQSLQEVPEDKTTPCEHIIFFLQLNELVKPEYRHLFIIDFADDHCNCIISGYINFSVGNATLDVTKIKDVNSIVDYALDLISDEDESKQFLNTKLILLFSIMEKYIADGKYIPEHENNDNFTKMIQQGYLLSILVTQINLPSKGHEILPSKYSRDAALYLLHSKYLKGDVNIDLKNKPESLNTFRFIDSNLLVNAIFLSSEIVVTELIKAGAQVTHEVLLKTTQVPQLSFSAHNEPMRINFDILLILLTNLPDDLFNNFPKECIGRCFFHSPPNNPNSLFSHIKLSQKPNDEKKISLQIIIKLLNNIDDATLLPYSKNIIALLGYFYILNHNEINHYNDDNTRYILMYFQAIHNQLIEQKPCPEIDMDTRSFLTFCLQNILKNKDNAFYFQDNYILTRFQVIFAVFFTSSDTSDEVKALYNTYLELPKVKALLNTKDIADNFGDLAGNVDWKDDNAFNYLIISESLVALITHQEMQYYTGIEKQDRVINWNNLFLFDLEGNSLPISQFTLSQIFTGCFPIFANTFISYNGKEMREQFIKSLSLEKYEDTFITAQNSAYSRVKLVFTQEISYNENYYLEQRLTQHINYIEPKQEEIVDGITAKHLAEIIAIFQLKNKSTEELAAYLMCLSYVFVKYSSQSIFGTESDSPYSIRKYAYALMLEAYKTNPSVFIVNNNNPTETTEISSAYAGWKEQLLGENKVVGCTDMLSINMLIHINEKYKSLYPQTIIQIIPLAWL